MAQTKQRAATKRAGGSKKPQAHSNSRANGGKATKPRASSKSTNGAKLAASKASVAMNKAKVPLMAGGAALVGAAGGLVMGNRHGRRQARLTKAVPHRPKIKVDSHDIAKAAKEVGNFGAQVGHLASELQRNRESANSDAHRSPVEIVLDGLTHRRSHS